jgi:hypothetical protein
MTSADTKLPADLRSRESKWQTHHEDYTIDMSRDLGSFRDEVESELLKSGVNLPLVHRSIWARAHRSVESWFISVRDARGKCSYGFAAEVTRSRAVPGHLILRVPRFGFATPYEGAMNAGLVGLAALSKNAGRVLRLHVELFTPDENVRSTIGGLARRSGFHPSNSPRHYTNTIAIDLTPTESDILASFSKYTRKNIRRIEKEAFAVKPIVDPCHGHRMNALLAETMRRTGGAYTLEDWASRIEMCHRYPSLSRLTGLFRTDVKGPEALVAFVWACANGDHVEYCTTASTRIEGSRLPLTYALAWDLIRWGKSIGAQWFDFGGVTMGSYDNVADPLAGISDFKRSFSKNVIRVGEEWVLEPHPLRAKFASIVSTAASRLQRLLVA